jgi:lysophospholipase L1-like esterase
LSQRRLSGRRWGAIAAGVALILIGLALVTALSVRSGAVVILAGLAITLIGGAGPRFPGLYRTAAVLTLNTIVLLLALEAAAILIGDSRQHGEATTYIHSSEARAALSYYQAQDWGRSYWESFAQLENQRERYVPYVVWRRRAFSSETIIVRADGTRATPGAQCGDEAYTVYVYGASTVWGTGSPDWGTIPAYLQAGLAAQRSSPVCVVNYGESGYVSTQDVILFMLHLQRGTIPDVAIFYGGANDLAAATQSAQPAVHINLADIAGRLEQSRWPLVRTLGQSAAVTLARDWLGESGATPADQGLGARGATLAESVADTYLANIRLAETLGQAYGVQVFFFWRPGIDIGAKPLTREEQAMRDELAADDRIDPALSADVQQRITQAASVPALTDLSAIFDGIDTLIWIDGLHVTPEGNRLIAAAVLEVIAPEN